MEELNAEVYVSCLTLISASGRSSTAINLGGELMGPPPPWKWACSDLGRPLAITRHHLSHFVFQTRKHEKQQQNPWRTFSDRILPLSFFWNALQLVAQGCRQEGELGGRGFGEVQRCTEWVSEALMFLGRLQAAADNPLIWAWGVGVCGREDVFLECRPPSSSPPETNTLIWQG